MRTDEPLEERYFKWLCAKVVNRPPASTPSLTYWKLMRILHQTEFVWFVPNDHNRVADGLELRTYFLREAQTEPDETWQETGCSVLEMLIAFANRAEFMTSMSAKDWFWKFLRNLHLSRMNDSVLDDPEGVSYILERFIWRTYEPNGVGGLFPIENPRRDQRDVELWYQFFDYIDDQNL